MVGPGGGNANIAQPSSDVHCPLAGVCFSWAGLPVRQLPAPSRAPPPTDTHHRDGTPFHPAGASPSGRFTSISTKAIGWSEPFWTSWRMPAGRR